MSPDETRLFNAALRACAANLRYDDASLLRALVQKGAEDPVQFMACLASQLDFHLLSSSRHDPDEKIAIGACADALGRSDDPAPVIDYLSSHWNDFLPATRQSLTTTISNALVQHTTRHRDQWESFLADPEARNVPTGPGR